MKLFSLFTRTLGYNAGNVTAVHPLAIQSTLRCVHRRFTAQFIT